MIREQYCIQIHQAESWIPLSSSSTHTHPAPLKHACRSASASLKPSFQKDASVMCDVKKFFHMSTHLLETGRSENRFCGGISAKNPNRKGTKGKREVGKTQTATKRKWDRDTGKEMVNMLYGRAVRENQKCSWFQAQEELWKSFCAEGAGVIRDMEPSEPSKGTTFAVELEDWWLGWAEWGTEKNRRNGLGEALKEK